MSAVLSPACSATTACSHTSIQRCRPAIRTVCTQRSHPRLPGAPRQRCSLSSRGCSSCRRQAGGLICRAEGSKLSQKFPEGTRVRVTQSITVWHAPKRKDGLDLKDMEGEVRANPLPIVAFFDVAVACEAAGRTCCYRAPLMPLK